MTTFVWEEWGVHVWITAWDRVQQGKDRHARAGWKSSTYLICQCKQLGEDWEWRHGVRKHVGLWAIFSHVPPTLPYGGVDARAVKAVIAHIRRNGCGWVLG